MRSHTPVGYWMNQPVLDVLGWLDVCAELAEEIRKKEDEAWQATKKNTP